MQFFLDTGYASKNDSCYWYEITIIDAYHYLISRYSDYFQVILVSNIPYIQNTWDTYPTQFTF